MVYLERSLILHYIRHGEIPGARDRVHKVRLGNDV